MRHVSSVPSKAEERRRANETQQSKKKKRKILPSFFFFAKHAGWKDARPMTLIVWISNIHTCPPPLPLPPGAYRVRNDDACVSNRVGFAGVCHLRKFCYMYERTRFSSSRAETERHFTYVSWWTMARVTSYCDTISRRDFLYFIIRSFVAQWNKPRDWRSIVRFSRNIVRDQPVRESTTCLVYSVPILSIARNCSFSNKSNVFVRIFVTLNHERPETLDSWKFQISSLLSSQTRSQA